MAALAARNIYIGTSSWKYPGWCGDIYQIERYLTRGKFSEKRFNETCLTEYAETFHTVGGDFSFYTFPKASHWEKLFNAVPAGFRFGLKVPEMVTCKRWPKHARYGARAGHENESFLDAGLFADLFLAELEPYRAKVGPIIFEFGAFAKADFAGVNEFADSLHGFLAALPHGHRYAVEVRNHDYLAAPYREALKSNNVAHVFNAWTRMPPLEAQVADEANHTADFIVCRALLKAGRTYENAVQEFQPYDRVQEVNASGRSALRFLVDRSRGRIESAYVYVNNRFEGNAPGTIRGILDGIGEDGGEGG